MHLATNDLSDLETKATAGEAFTRADGERLLSCQDLLSVGMVGEAARKSVSGDRVTFGRVSVIDTEGPPAEAERGDAGEVRLAGRAVTALRFDEMRRRVRAAATSAAGVPVTGFSLIDLLEVCGHDHLALVEHARTLRGDGLEALADAPIDRFGSGEEVAEVIRAVRHGGLAVWRLTVDRAPLADRLDLICRAQDVQARLGTVQAFAPLPAADSAEAPSTGYDDVRTIAVARALCRNIPFIQVDWRIYGPKLAQVAIAYGANDLDGIAAVDVLHLGARRSPAADIARQIRAAGAEPVERNARFEVRS